MKSVFKQSLILLFGGFALVLGFWMANKHLAGDIKFVALEPLPQTVKVHEVDLQNQLGQKVNANFFEGRWSLLYFGFTSCPDLCPMELQQLARVYRQLNIREQQLLNLVFVTLDPERDTADKMKGYLAFFDPHFIGLRGSNRQIDSFAKNFSLYYQREYLADGTLIKVPAGFDMPQNAPIDYQVEHGSRIYLISRQGEFMGSFPPPHSVDSILSDLRQLLKK